MIKYFELYFSLFYLQVNRKYLIKFAKIRFFSIIDMSFILYFIIMAQTQDSVQQDQQVVVNQQPQSLDPQVAPEVQQPSVQPSIPSTSEAVPQEQGFLNSMITKGVQGIASLTGYPDPVTGANSQGTQPSAPISSPSEVISASIPETSSAPVPQEKGFFSKLFDGAKNVF
jgi:hypothetical protein